MCYFALFRFLFAPTDFFILDKLLLLRGITSNYMLLCPLGICLCQLMSHYLLKLFLRPLGFYSIYIMYPLNLKAVFPHPPDVFLNCKIYLYPIAIFVVLTRSL